MIVVRFPSSKIMHEIMDFPHPVGDDDDTLKKVLLAQDVLLNHDQDYDKLL